MISSCSVATATLWHDAACCVGSGVGNAAGLSSCSLPFYILKITMRFLKEILNIKYTLQTKGVLHSKLDFEKFLYLCRSILVLAAARIGVPQGTIAIPLDVSATLALLHRVGDGTLSVPARLDFCALLRPSRQIAVDRRLIDARNFAIRRNESTPVPVISNKRSSLANRRDLDMHV